MVIDIITPDEILFSGDVTSITVPGVQGIFQILENHAFIVSDLKKGTVRLQENSTTDKTSKSEKVYTDSDNNTCVDIVGGVVEINNNKCVILVG